MTSDETNVQNQSPTMTTDVQVTNDETAGHCGKNASSFRLGHSFVIRHWSFVIFSTSRLLLILLLMLSVSCVGKRLRKANVDEVSEGMTKKQVESILGPPTNIDNKDFIVMKKTVYEYRQGKD